MSYRTSLKKIVQLAIRAEEAGQRYYHALAGKNEDRTVKSLLLFFAEQEKEHSQTFKTMANDIRHGEADKEFSLDVESLMNEEIEQLKTGFDRIQAGPVNVRTVLEQALNIEKETAQLYRNIQDAFVGRHQDVLFKIIREEDSHAEMIEKAMANYPS